MLFRKEKSFSKQEMEMLEVELKSSILSTMFLRANDPDLPAKLGLEVVFTDCVQGGKIAELLPTNNPKFCGMIRIKTGSENIKFNYVHEIVRYVFDVGRWRKVKADDNQGHKANKKSYSERKIDYFTDAFLMPVDQISAELEKYDHSSPKMDEIKFLQNLREKFGVDNDTIVRRIGQV